ncbi:hypothetical protein CBER1_08788 [Cercospora berteroae]|uniref:Uncharacterized protein n=1 Tax=Cercospora berteroae TaxID=357750 RepID=A0A2S6BWP2_9PEZI|nr:hypothetical protein CBER1_08788 [Cercospora berteroae]
MSSAARDGQPSDEGVMPRGPTDDEGSGVREGGARLNFFVARSESERDERSARSVLDALATFDDDHDSVYSHGDGNNNPAVHRRAEEPLQHAYNVRRTFSADSLLDEPPPVYTHRARADEIAGFPPEYQPPPAYEREAGGGSGLVMPPPPASRVDFTYFAASRRQALDFDDGQPDRSFPLGGTRGRAPSLASERATLPSFFDGHDGDSFVTEESLEAGSGERVEKASLWKRIWGDLCQAGQTPWPRKQSSCRSLLGWVVLTALALMAFCGIVVKTT